MAIGSGADLHLIGKDIADLHLIGKDIADLHLIGKDIRDPRGRAA